MFEVAPGRHCKVELEHFFKKIGPGRGLNAQKPDSWAICTHTLHAVSRRQCRWQYRKKQISATRDPRTSIICHWTAIRMSPHIYRVISKISSGEGGCIGSPSAAVMSLMAPRGAVRTEPICELVWASSDTARTPFPLWSRQEQFHLVLPTSMMKTHMRHVTGTSAMVDPWTVIVRVYWESTILYPIINVRKSLQHSK